MNTTTPSKTPVADYFRDPKRFCKELYAINSDGAAVDINDPTATGHDLIGATRWLHPGEEGKGDAWDALGKLAAVIRKKFRGRIEEYAMTDRAACVLFFSDHPETTPADVLAVCLEARV